MTSIDIVHGVALSRFRCADGRECSYEVEEALISVTTSSIRAALGCVIAKVQGSTGICLAPRIVACKDGRPSLIHERCSIRHGIGSEIGEAVPVNIIYGAFDGRGEDRAGCAEPSIAVGVANPV